MATVLQNALALLQSSRHADFTVKCEEFEWKVHHIILASGSKFFEKVCGGNFQSLYKLEFGEEEPTLTESTQQEAADKVITLHDDEPEMVARMLLCLYTSHYPVQLKERNFPDYPTVEEFMKKGYPKFQTDSFEHETNPFLVHSKVYAIADKYDMPGLQAICVTKFNHDEYKLPNFVDALPHVFSSTPPSQTALKQKAAALVLESYREIMHNPSLKAKLGTACVQHGQLGWDVFSNLSKICGRRCILCDSFHPMV